MSSPFFFFFIPTYNRARFIGKTIQSVLAQQFQDFEIIVVDDGSTDNTRNEVAKIKNSNLFYHRKENGERGAARNYGAKKARGQYVTFLDSDDLVYNHHLATAKRFCDDHSPVIFHLNYDIKDEKGKLIRPAVSLQNINSEILTGNVLSCNGVFIKTEIFLDNQFVEDIALASLEDWELWIRMSSRYSFLNSNVVTSTVVQHDARSVLDGNTQRIKTKAEKFCHYVLTDEKNKIVYGNKLNQAKASALTYAALHLVMANEKNAIVFKYLCRGIKENPREILRKRFFAILKKIILG